MKKKIALATLAMIPMAVSDISAASQMGVVTASSLNVRSGPGTNNSVLFTVKKNDKVEIKDSSNGWYKIKTSTSREGWVSSTYISKSESSSNNQATVGQKKTNTNVNFRSGAGTNYSIIATLSKGTVVDVISEKSGWTQVKYNGKVGYISSTYLDNINSGSNSNSSQSITKEVNTNSLNVRSGPSTNHSILGKLNKGVKVPVISENSGWSKITYNGKDAYVSSQYLSSVGANSDSSSSNKPSDTESNKKTKVVNTSSLNVRSGPGTNYSKIGTLTKGTKVSVISENNGWSKITYNGKDAYVSSSYLDNVDVNNPIQPEDKVETKEVNTSSLNVRSGPGTNYSKIGTLAKGSKVDVLSESNGWSKINYNGKEGYVSSQYLSKINNDTNGSITPPVISGDSTQIVNGATINHKGLSYTLNDHVNAQLERANLGGNVIDSSKPRSSEVLTTFNMREAQSRAFVKADKNDLEYFLNPANFKNSKKGMLQFLRIDSYKGGISVSSLNSFLNSNGGTSGVFYNKGQAFIDAAKKYDIDLVYLVAHSMWETGYGKSTLAQGQTITTYKGQPLSKPVKVYNFFGIGAIDGSANLSGAEAAYSNGWTTVEKTIDGSAKWIASNYIKSSKYNQNTIYKMKFNYEYTWHQYATDVNWANGISGIMAKLVDMYSSGSNLVFEVPNYKG